ncbi:hypothetical protein [Actinacidiphila glaucinigra]|uniref:hypothetical protein n=1 Tax=Actinacidiphila glaucinigra TaxID=235986 RepID=UPI0035DD4676
MDQALSAAIAVGGTLLGVALTYWFQRQSARHAEECARQHYLRAERASAYSAFAAAVTQLSRAQLDRWHRPREAPADPDNSKVRLAAFDQRSHARQAFFRVQLLAGSEELIELARNAMDSTRPLAHATDEAESERLTLECRAAVERFIQHAAREVQ